MRRGGGVCSHGGEFGGEMGSTEKGESQGTAQAESGGGAGWEFLPCSSRCPRGRRGSDRRT